jgi:hypothetical protein
MPEPSACAARHGSMIRPSRVPRSAIIPSCAGSNSIGSGCRISPQSFAVLTIIVKTTTDSSSTRIVTQAGAALLHRRIMSLPRNSEDNDDGERQVRHLVFLDRCLTNAGQMLDPLLGRFRRSIGRDSKQVDSDKDVQAHPPYFLVFSGKSPEQINAIQRPFQAPGYDSNQEQMCGIHPSVYLSAINPSTTDCFPNFSTSRFPKGINRFNRHRLVVRKSKIVEGSPSHRNKVPQSLENDRGRLPALLRAV